jgi:hypothetical protein
MATSIFDHPYVILIVIAASILRWLWQKSQEGKQDPERPVVPDEPIPRGGESQTEEERIRRFLEALGQPRGSAPPPKVEPKRRVQPSVVPKLPQLTTVPPPLPPSPAPIAKAPPALPREERIFKPALVQEMGFEVRDLSAQISTEAPVESSQTDTAQASLRSKLTSIEGLRSAIILREIFGPPRSLQPPDLVGGF